MKEETDEEEQEKYTFGFSGITMENPYFITLESSIRETLEKDGHTLITEDPKQDPDVQVEQIEDMIDQGIDAIFLTPVDWEAITPALEELKEADVKIINVDTQVKEFDYVDAYIGSDNKNAGYLCGKDLVEKLPEGGKVLILECPTMNSINERITGFEEAIADKGFEVVGRSDTKGDLNTALSAAETLLKEHPDVSAIMCGNDPTALGALVAANAAQLQNVYIYGVDGSPEIKKELEKENSLIFSVHFRNRKEKSRFFCVKLRTVFAYHFGFLGCNTLDGIGFIQGQSRINIPPIGDISRNTHLHTGFKIIDGNRKFKLVSFVIGHKIIPFPSYECPGRWDSQSRRSCLHAIPGELPCRH